MRTSSCGAQTCSGAKNSSVPAGLLHQGPAKRSSPACLRAWPSAGNRLGMQRGEEGGRTLREGRIHPNRKALNSRVSLGLHC